MPSDSTPAAAAKDKLRVWATDSAVNLAVFRVAVGLVLLRLPDLHSAVRWAALPDEVRTAPVGWSWAIGTIPMTPELVRVGYWVVIASAITGTLGLFSRTSFAIVTLASLYVLGIPQFAGSAFHYHHLVWFAALLAVSPCGDALSLDAMIANKRGRSRETARGLAYGVPIRAAWLLVGAIFFFPGLHKLITSGLAWALSDNLRNQIYAKWLQNPRFHAAFRVDEHPTLLRAGALFTLLFELSFPFLVVFRRTRLWAVLAALAFHQATSHVMGLRFDGLWQCYVVFVDWRRVIDWVRAKRGQEPRTATTSTRDARGPIGIAAMLLAGSVLAGALGVNDGWPFACYPKFDRVMGTTLPALGIEIVNAAGETVPVPIEWIHPEGRNPRYWAVSWSLLGAHERARASPERFRAYLRSIARRPELHEALRGAREVRFYRETLSTLPGDRDAAPLDRRRVATIRFTR